MQILLYPIISLVIDLIVGLICVPFHLMSEPGTPIYTATGKVTDVAGHTYPTVVLGNQEWLAENLDVSRFNDGSDILEAKSQKDWINAIQSQKPAWAWAEYDATTGKSYGKIYNWYAISDPRGLAPNGWSIPGKDDWKKLLINAKIYACEVDTRNHTSIGSESEFNAEALQGSEAGWKLFTFWEGMYLFDTVWGTDVGSNETGFNALPGGLIGDVDEIGQGGEMQSETAKVQEWSGWWGADRSCLVIGDHVDGDNHDSVNLIRFDNIYSGMYVRLVKKN